MWWRVVVGTVEFILAGGGFLGWWWMVVGLFQ